MTKGDLSPSVYFIPSAEGEFVVVSDVCYILGHTVIPVCLKFQCGVKS